MVGNKIWQEIGDLWCSDIYIATMQLSQEDNYFSMTVRFWVDYVISSSITLITRQGIFDDIFRDSSVHLFKTLSCLKSSQLAIGVSPAQWLMDGHSTSWFMSHPLAAKLV